MNLVPYLEDLASRIDPDEEQPLHSAWEEFLDGRYAERNDRSPTTAFEPSYRTPKPPAITWPEIHINDALADIDTMVLHQLSMVSGALASGSNTILNVRANYGVSIMTSQLGCEVVTMPREHGNLPTARPLPGLDAIRDVVQSGVPDLRTGQGSDVFDCSARFRELFQSYDVLQRWVHTYHPDTQGPIDNAELAWGSGIFLAFCDTPELVHQFLDVMTEHYIAFMEAWFAEHPPTADVSAHWGYMIKGQVMLRDDSLMNLSPEIYDEFIYDREARCLDSFGGGAIHFCGRGTHVIDRLNRIASLSGVNMSQPHLNDMETVLDATVDRGLALLALKPEAVAETDRDLKGLVHCQ